MEFQFNSIQFKINDIQVGGEGIINILLNVVFRKNKLLKYVDPKSTFLCFFTWEWTNQILVSNFPSNNNDNDLRLMESKVVLPKQYDESSLLELHLEVYSN